MVKKVDTRGVTTSKDDKFSEWFAQLMIKAELADYTKVSGCLVFRPNSYSIWEKIKDLCDIRFKKIGVQNVYFPMFIPESLLTKEAEHVEGFAPEVAWVEKAGNTKLGERLAVRPTSEAIMYDSYSKWIRSWRDLPMQYNQWNSVVRWEFKHPVPFLRTREFLWNEIHSAFATEKEAVDEGKKILDAYKDVCENYMALYGVIGRKTEKEKFAGAEYTEKIHHVMPNGRVIEGAAFHHDGQKFAKAYNIKFLNKEEKEEYAWQNTAAISTRMLGAMFAIHSDDKGLVLPPKLANHRAVIIPILMKGKEKSVLDLSKDLENKLKKYKVFVDERQGVRPGEKYHEWELKGIPIRIEIGPKDVEAKSVVIVRRDTGTKEKVPFGKIGETICNNLENIQKGLYEKSKKAWESRIDQANDLKDLISKIKKGKIVEIPLSKEEKIEDEMKEKTGGVKTLFISEKKLKKGTKCIISGKEASYYVFVAKTY